MAVKKPICWYGPSKKIKELQAGDTLPGGAALLNIAYIDDTDSPYTPGTEDLIVCDLTNGDIDIDLPALASNEGKQYYIKVLADSPASNRVKVDGNGAELIDNKLTQTLKKRDNMFICATSIEWVIL